MLVFSGFNYANTEDNLPVLKIDQAMDSFISLKPFTEVYVDSSTTLHLEDVQSRLKQGRFQAISKLILGPKYQRGKFHYWLTFSIENKLNESSNYTLAIGRHVSLVLYQIQNKITKIKLAGESNVIFLMFLDYTPKIRKN